MSAPFYAEVRIFATNFAPTGWAQCNGQLLPIAQNTALFALLGSTYGGDAKVTFALPNLMGSTPVGAGQGQGLSEKFLGEQSGAPTVTLLQSEIPVHNHGLTVSGEAALERQPVNQKLATGDGVSMYDTNSQPTTQLDPRALTVAGGSLPHNNYQPSIALNFCISLGGVFPPRG